MVTGTLLPELSAILLRMPPPPWRLSPTRSHHKTSCSGYPNCPERLEKRGASTFPQNRGDVFHGYFGGPILDYLQLPGCDIELALETLGNCPICGEGGFKFGGSVDAYHAASETLIDFKFSTHCGDAAYLESNYIPQLAAYRNLLELHNKPVSKVLLIAVHPESFVAIHYDWTDLTAWKQEYETLIIDHHLSKVHHRPCYRPNPFCHFCDRAECSAKKRKGTARLEKIVLDARIAEEKANMVHAVSGCENPPKDYTDLGLAGDSQ